MSSAMTLLGLRSKANAAWRVMGHGMQELVALSFIEGSGSVMESLELSEGGSDAGYPLADSTVMYELVNRRVDAGAFDVAATEVHGVLERVSMVPELNRASRILWHTHTKLEGPSQYDIDEFPWFVQLGMIFHVPSGLTTLYNGAGIISVNGTSSNPSRQVVA